MLSIERLHEQMQGLATLATDDPHRLERVVARAGRRRKRLLAATSSTVVVLVAVAATVAVRELGRPTSRLSASTSIGYLDWPARGPARADGQLLESATAAWNTGGARIGDTGPHTNVRLLYAAGGNAVVGTIVIVQGTAAEGGSRVALLTGGRGLTGSVSTALVLRADEPTPAAAVPEISFLLRRLPATAEVDSDPYATSASTLPDGTLAIALAAPGDTIWGFTSTAWDTGGNSIGADFAAVMLPASATRFNVDVRVVVDGHQVNAGPVDGLGLAEPADPVGGILGQMAVYYLPPGVRPVGSTDTSAADGRRIVTQSYSGSGDAEIQISVETGPPLDLSSLSIAGMTANESNAAGGKKALAFEGDSERRQGFAWNESAGLSVVVTAVGLPQIQIYYVTQGMVKIQQ